MARSAPANYNKVASRIVDVADLEHPLRCVFYGRAGSGKTTLAASFPNALLIDIKNEEGTASVSDVKGLKVFSAETWEELEEIYWYLSEAKHTFKTVILDTVTQMQELAIRHVLTKSKKKVEEGDEGGWGTMTKQTWGDVATLMKTWIGHYRELGINVVFLAQERIFNAGDDVAEDVGQIDPEVGPRLMPSVSSTLNAAVDVIAHLFVREKIVRKRDKATKKTEETRTIQFCARVGPHGYYITKVRKPKDVVTPAFLVDPTYEDLIELRDGEK